MIKSESLAKFAPAFLKAQRKMGAALKDSKNPFFKSKYADLNAIIDAAIPALNDEGICVLQPPDVEIIGGKSVIQTMLLHESGEFIISNMEVTPAKVNDPQAAGSATTYSRRYGLQAMVTLKAEDDDAEAGMGRAVKATPAKTVAVGITGDLDGKGTSSPTLSTSVVTAATEKKKVSFAKKPLVEATTTVEDDI